MQDILSPQVALQTLGCKLNQAESELLAEQFRQAGFEVVEPKAGVDIYVLNTCTVTHVADRKARHLLRLARRRHPEALVVATGCYAQRAPREMEALGAANLVVPQGEKSQLVSRVTSLVGGADRSSAVGASIGGRTRSFIKIQDGCHAGCSYCIVPQVRGREISLSPDDIVSQVREGAAQGYREVVLTGTKIGGYRWDGCDLTRLVARLLRETGIERLHLSSLQPQEITPSLLALWSDGRLCRHIHMPLQSGSDPVLERMGRRYLTVEFRQAVQAVREAVPDMAVTTDVMVGFPGESQEEFEESWRFCRETGFSALHIFPYSPRPGTQAAQMAPVESKSVNGRSQEMHRLALQSAESYQRQFLGKTLPMLWEQEVGPGIWSGHSDNYLRVLARSQKPLANRISLVRLSALSGGVLWGEILSHSRSFTTG